MYAVILTGGKQYTVKVGDMIDIEKLDYDVAAQVEFDKVLLVGDGDDIKIGTPYLTGAKVLAEVAEQKRDKKVKILKFRRRKHSMTHMGHRQYLTKVKIADIKLGDVVTHTTAEEGK